VNNIKVEICINSDTNVKQSVTAAYLGGANTIELCGRMNLDGLTPLPTDIASAREAFADRPGLMVMIRPRGGDFCYSRAEVAEMEMGIETAVSLGADGVVFGAIHNNSLNLKTMRRLTHLAHKHNLTTTCHRAFDAVGNPSEALDTLIDLGINRLLTSGTAWGSQQSVVDGIPHLTHLIQQADNRIEIILGGGIHLDNVLEILTQLPTKDRLLTVHTYSGVLRDGMTDKTAVSQLVAFTKP